MSQHLYQIDSQNFLRRYFHHFHQEFIHYTYEKLTHLFFYGKIRENLMHNLYVSLAFHNGSNIASFHENKCVKRLSEPYPNERCSFHFFYVKLWLHIQNSKILVFIEFIIKFIFNKLWINSMKMTIWNTSKTSYAIFFIHVVEPGQQSFLTKTLHVQICAYHHVLRMPNILSVLNSWN